MRKVSCNLFTLSIVLMPILNTYRCFIDGFGIGDMLVTVALINLVLYKQQFEFNLIHVPNYLFFFYALLVSLISVAIHLSFSLRDIVFRLLIFLFYTAIICIPQNEDFDRDSFCNLYVKIATICCVYVIIQFIAFYVFKRPLLGVLPGVPLNYSIKSYSELLSKYSSMYLYFFRPTSFFPEPAYFAQFMGPALLIVLFGNGVNNRFFYAIFFSVSALLSTSTNAIVIVGFAWICYLIHENIIQQQSMKLFKSIVWVLLLYVGIVLISKISETFIYGLSRIENLLDGNSESGSSYERIIKGFDIWKQLGFCEKIFGIGFGTYDSYYKLGTINVYNGEVEYMSSISYILVCGGVISIVLFMAMLINYLDKKSFFNITLLMLLLLLFFSSSIFNSPIYAVIMLLIRKKQNYILGVN